jgi:hypothetical protein
LTRFSLELSALKASGSQSMDFIYLFWFLRWTWPKRAKKEPKFKKINCLIVHRFFSQKLSPLWVILKLIQKRSYLKKKIEQGLNGPKFRNFARLEGIHNSYVLTWCDLYFFELIITRDSGSLLVNFFNRLWLWRKLSAGKSLAAVVSCYSRHSFSFQFKTIIYLKPLTYPLISKNSLKIINGKLEP